jgi:RNA polymerase sigma-70 factor (ECF subfamily)
VDRAIAGQPAKLDESIVGRAAAGDHVAFTQIVATHHTDLLRIAQVICGDVDMADDAAQAAWAIAWRRLGSLREPASLRPWLMSIAANEARQMIRHRSRSKVREILVEDEGARFDASAAARLDLGRALAAIDPGDRQLLALRYISGLESAEIGREVGMSATAVRSRLARAIRRLRTELDHD